MFYVLLTADGSVDRYPYTLTDLRRANPGTSFPKKISDETAAEFNCFPVTPATQPADDYTVNLSRTAIKQGDYWVEEWISTPATPEQITERTEAKAAEVRQQRNELLTASDWTQFTDSPLGVDAKLAWALYRESLRMVPEQPNFPWDVDWPVPPQ
jgi:hypothetical protein